MKTILEKVFAAKRRRVEKAKGMIDPTGLAGSAFEIRERSEAHRLRSSIQAGDRLNIIAEFKKASPSKGVINDGRSAAETARTYEQAGAAAISVLTEEDYFMGSLGDLRTVRDAVSIPILRKDFIFDDFQIYEAAAAGADAVLLIVAALDIADLRDLHQLAEDRLGMDALVEVHTERELDTAKEIGARLIGVNNRDLHSFDVSLDVSRRLAAEAADGALLISESGLSNRDELLELKGLGYSGFLIGETLMRSGDISLELRRLAGTAA